MNFRRQHLTNDQWWYNVLYLYTSATVLIAARLSTVILAEVGEDSILNAWQKAVEALEGYNSFGVSMQRLTTTLRLLSETVPQQYSRLRGFARQEQEVASVGPPNPSQGTMSMAMPYWHPLGTIELSAPAEELTSYANLDDSNGLSNDFSFDFGTGFDPNDLSWLMTFPLES